MIANSAAAQTSKVWTGEGTGSNTKTFACELWTVKLLYTFNHDETSGPGLCVVAAPSHSEKN